MQNRLNFRALNILLTLAAVITGVLLIINTQKDFVVLFASFYLILICAIDAKYSKIPNLITLSFFLMALIYNVTFKGMDGFLFSLLGSISGLGLMLLPFLFGGFGAGDVKALAALGALVGSETVFHVFLYMGITGGIIAITYFCISGNLIIFAKILSQNVISVFFTNDLKFLKFDPIEKRIKFPYAIAIAFGFYVYEFFGSIF